MTHQVDKELDLSQEESPVPMIKTKETLDSMSQGSVLKVKVSKESAVQNIKTLVSNNEFQLLDVYKQQEQFILLIKKN
jgi:TusA-related sulfurtransferase